jgi:hypothetical protein
MSDTPEDTLAKGLYLARLIPERFEELQDYATGCLSNFPENVPAARENLIEYLFSLWDMLRVCDADQETCDVLYMLCYALQDLQRGADNQLLKAQKKPRAKPQFDLEVLIEASAAISALITYDKKSEKEAAEIVARKLRDYNATAQPGPGAMQMLR